MCRTANNRDWQIADTARFSSQLKGWPDYSMSPLQKAKILGALSMEPHSQEPKEDIVYTLITTILYHFVRNTNTLKEQTQ